VSEQKKVPVVRGRLTFSTNAAEIYEGDDCVCGIIDPNVVPEMILRGGPTIMRSKYSDTVLAYVVKHARIVIPHDFDTDKYPLPDWCELQEDGDDCGCNKLGCSQCDPDWIANKVKSVKEIEDAANSFADAILETQPELNPYLGDAKPVTLSLNGKTFECPPMDGGMVTISSDGTRTQEVSAGSIPFKPGWGIRFPNGGKIVGTDLLIEGDYEHVRPGETPDEEAAMSFLMFFLEQQDVRLGEDRMLRASDADARTAYRMWAILRGGKR
jgi:hypothetical protein